MSQAFVCILARVATMKILAYLCIEVRWRIRIKMCMAEIQTPAISHVHNYLSHRGPIKK